jgi:hypothetical protein
MPRKGRSGWVIFLFQACGCEAIHNLALAQQRVDILSILKFSTLEMKLKGERTLSLSSGNAMIEGTIKDHGFSRKNLFEMKGLRFADRSIPRLKSRSSIDYQKGEVAIRNLMIEMEDLRLSANHVTITVPQIKTDSHVEIRSMHAAYRSTKALLKEGDFHLTFSPSEKGASGDLRFSAENILSQGITFSHLSGSGRFDDKNFSVNIAGAEVAGGRIKVALCGRASESLFPIRTTFLAENIDLRAILNAASKSIKLPHHIVGDEKLLTPDQKRVVTVENGNRKTVINGMAKAILTINRVPENEQNLNQVMPQAVEQFATIRRESAKKGWWIQASDGNWLRK